ncbi:MAG: hypothetical protein KIH64_003905 [Mycobacterium sp.]|nr:hypothetical protein [Mycobacterium sp.]
MGTMKTTTKSGRLAAALSAPLAAVGILLGGSPIAGAQPAADNQCAGMSMTDGRTGPNPSALTRAGMINAASGPSASDGSMQSNCAPAGHG